MLIASGKLLDVREPAVITFVPHLLTPVDPKAPMEMKEASRNPNRMSQMQTSLPGDPATMSESTIASA
jgi:hypothetical protein